MASSKNQYFCLKTLLKEKLVDEILGANIKQDPHQVLVLDSHTSKIIGSCCTMSSLLGKGFVAIQNLDFNRQTIDLPATYFLDLSGQDHSETGHTEDADKLKVVLQDFTAGPDWNPETKAGTRLKKKYLRAYINVTLSLKAELIQDVLKQEARFIRSCRALNEVNIDFLSYESRVFLLNQPYVLEKFMNPSEEAISESSRVIERIIKQLVSLCIAMNEKPYVRYEMPTGSRIEKYIQFLVASKTGFGKVFEETVKNLPNWKARPNPATMLFLNRATDMAAPLIHHINYQSVLVDVLGMQGDVLTIELENQKENKKEVKSYVLNETDEIWREKRHLHFDAFKNKLNDDIGKFKKKSTTNQFRDGKMDDKTMLAVVKDLPKYREMTRLFARHQNICKAAGKALKPKVPAITILQDLACGLSSDCSTLKPQTNWSVIKELLEKPETAYLDKASIALLYVIARGGMSNDEKSFFEDILDAGTMAAINNLQLLGVNTGKPSKPKALDKGHQEMIKTRLKRMIKEKGDAKSPKKSYIIGNRYLSKVYYACRQLAEDKLDKKAYPYVNPPPKSAGRSNARSTGFSVRRNRHKRQESRMGNSDKPRLIIFVLGGITAAEMASVYEIGEQWKVEIVIGSTDIITSEETLKSLSQGQIKKNQDLNPSIVRDPTNI
mmetsp:Transcript_28911/g.46403  ORF Transcript_28911/g.46403 Transcript_28911/m.46403 type:complete len:665 (+) Transcript_28911:173-2167(+)|eukprot:jgi/Bigna1/85423/estExt_fgenesh1_pg.C_40056